MEVEVAQTEPQKAVEVAKNCDYDSRKKRKHCLANPQGIPDSPTD